MKKLLTRCLALALTGCMVFQMSALAAEVDAEVPTGLEVESVMEELEAEDAPEVVEEEAVIPSEGVEADTLEVGQDDIIIEEDGSDADLVLEDGMAVVDSMEVYETQEETDAGSSLAPFTEEELVGAIPTVSLNTVYSFSCTKSAYQFYSFKPSSTGVYRVDISGTKGRVISGVLIQNSDNTVDDWNYHGLYENNVMKYTTYLEAGKTYLFGIAPETYSSDSGKFKLRKVTQQVTGFSLEYYTNKTFYVGPKGDGKWDTNDDGSKNLNVWLFHINEMYSILDNVKITLKNGTTTSTVTWKTSDGAEVGTTGLLVVPEQVTEGWKLDQAAYFNVYIGNMVTSNKMQIKYIDPLFTDVRDEDHAYYKAIYWAANKGITKGYSDGSFGINKPCTRGHAVQFLWKMAGSPDPKAVASSPFPDVPKTHAYYKAVLWAKQKDIAKGYTTGANAGKFGINDTCTRGQIMSFIWRFKKKPNPAAVSVSPFSDVPKTHVYYKAVLWGSQNGVTKGYTTGPKAGQFGVDDNCTRGQIVRFLYNIR